MSNSPKALIPLKPPENNAPPQKCELSMRHWHKMMDEEAGYSWVTQYLHEKGSEEMWFPRSEGDNGCLWRLQKVAEWLLHPRIKAPPFSRTLSEHELRCQLSTSCWSVHHVVGHASYIMTHDRSEAQFVRCMAGSTREKSVRWSFEGGQKKL